jgi:protoheme IX farnesyltransferase
MRSDYDDAGVPMLTVTHGRPATRLHILVYTVLLAPVPIALGLTEVGGPVTLTLAIGLSAWFLKGAVEIYRRDEVMAEADNYKVEKSFFRFSLYYLFVMFGALLIDALIRGIA